MVYYARARSYSRSYNAECAEEEGRYPLIRACEAMAQKYSIKKTVARVLLEEFYADGEQEWHHVGKYANKVNYYDTVRGHAAGIARLLGKKATKNEAIKAIRHTREKMRARAAWKRSDALYERMQNRAWWRGSSRWTEWLKGELSREGCTRS